MTHKSRNDKHDRPQAPAQEREANQRRGERNEAPDEQGTSSRPRPAGGGNADRQAPGRHHQ